MTQDPKNNNIADWERGLEQLRQRRQHPTQRQSPTTTPNPTAQTKQPLQPSPQAPQPKLEGKAREKVLLEYLKQWQDEHNNQLRDSEVEIDANVLLQEDWLRAQNALQFSVDQSKIKANKTVWLKRKASPEEEGALMQAHQGLTENHETEIEIEVSQVPINVQVLEPTAVRAHAPVMCINESDLYERLSKRLRPHLTDAVNGMVRVAIQRQVALLTHELQQKLHAETPNLVDEILQYNLKTVMSEIRYELKYRKR